MNARRLEEIFEECVTAYLEGRRSIQESLQLYPAFAAELAPLLRTAVQLNESFSTVDPPAYVQERVRHRFLSDARARRQVRSLSRGQRSAGFFAGFWQRNHLGFAAAAGAVAVLVVAVGSAAMLSNGGSAGDGGNFAGNLTTAPATTVRPTPDSVRAIQAKIDDITSRIQRGEQIKAEDLSDLQSATVSVQQQDVDDSRDQVTQTLQAADAVVTAVITQQPELAQPAQAAKDTLRDVASGFDIDLDATPAPTPVPTGETPTTQPTQQATEQPTDAPTPEPTSAPTDTPVPTPTPIRGLPGENP